MNPGFSLLNYHEMLKILHWNVMLLDNLYSIYRIVVPRNWAFISHSLKTLIRHQNTTESNHIWDQNNPYILTFNYQFFMPLHLLSFQKTTKHEEIFYLKRTTFTFSQLWLASYCWLTFSRQDAFLELLQVSDRLLVNVDSAFVQLYHGENKLIFNEMMMRSALY